MIKYVIFHLLLFTYDPGVGSGGGGGGWGLSISTVLEVSLGARDPYPFLDML